MRLGALFSGGKDSSYAMYLMLEQGFEVSCLLTLRPSSADSYMFHYPNIDLTDLQAEALGSPLLSRKTEGRKETELDDLSELLKEAKAKNGIEGVISGAIDSDYQKTRVDRVSHEVGLKSFSPLWRKNPVNLLRDQYNAGFTSIIAGVYAHGFDKLWLGRPMDEATIEALSNLQARFGIHPSGEGGEYESLVTDAPIFKQKLHIDDAKTDWTSRSETGTYQILKAHLESK